METRKRSFLGKFSPLGAAHLFFSSAVSKKQQPAEYKEPFLLLLERTTLGQAFETYRLLLDHPSDNCYFYTPVAHMGIAVA